MRCGSDRRTEVERERERESSKMIRKGSRVNETPSTTCKRERESEQALTGQLYFSSSFLLILIILNEIMPAKDSRQILHYLAFIQIQFCFTFHAMRLLDCAIAATCEPKVTHLSRHF